MTEETNRQEPAAFDASQEIDQLRKRLQAMDRKNAELLDEYKKAVEKSKLFLMALIFRSCWTSKLRQSKQTWKTRASTQKPDRL